MLNADGKIMLVVEIRMESNTPYYLKAKGREQGVYVRLGATNRQADDQMIYELDRDRLNISYDGDNDRNQDKIPPELLEVLTHRLMRTVTNKTLENLGLYNPAKTPPLIAHACALLLGQREETQIRCARIKGDSDYVFIDRKDCSGDMFTQIEQALAFVKNHLQLRSKKVNNLNRVSEFEIPVDSVSEALINAVIHRDYAVSKIFTKVTVYDDRVEIMTPGGLMRGLQLSDAMNGRSEPRNRILARIFHEADWIEQWGIGLPKILRLCAEENLPTPEFIDSGSTFTVKIYRPVNDNRQNRKIPEDTGRYRKIPEDNYSPHRRAILEMFTAKTEITAAEVMQTCNIKKSQAHSTLQRMIEDGEVIQVGAARSTRYIRTEKSTDEK